MTNSTPAEGYYGEAAGTLHFFVSDTAAMG